MFVPFDGLHSRPPSLPTAAPGNHPLRSVSESWAGLGSTSEGSHSASLLCLACFTQCPPGPARWQQTAECPPSPWLSIVPLQSGKNRPQKVKAISVQFVQCHTDEGGQQQQLREGRKQQDSRHAAHVGLAGPGGEGDVCACRAGHTEGTTLFFSVQSPRSHDSCNLGVDDLACPRNVSATGFQGKPLASHEGRCYPRPQQAHWACTETWDALLPIYHERHTGWSSWGGQWSWNRSALWMDSEN